MVFSTRTAWRPPASTKHAITTTSTNTRRNRTATNASNVSSQHHHHHIVTTYPPHLFSESKEQHQSNETNQTQNVRKLTNTSETESKTNEKITEGCLCEVCVCGKHRCAAQPNSEHYHDLTTENKARYALPNNYLANTQSCKPVQAFKPYATKLDDCTIYKQEFHALNLKDAKRTSLRPHPIPDEEVAPFYPETTANSSYTKNSLARAKRDPYHAVQSPFQRQSKSEYVTENRAAFHPIPLPKRIPKPKLTLPPSESFYGESTSKHDFVPHAGSHRRITCGQELPSTNLSDTRTFQTEHSQQYIHHPVVICPAVSRRQTASTVCQRQIAAK